MGAIAVFGVVSYAFSGGEQRADALLFRDVPFSNIVVLRSGQLDGSLIVHWFCQEAMGDDQRRAYLETLLALLLPGESVLDALRRLGPTRWVGQ